MTAAGRPPPTADVGYPVAQVGGQLSGCELAQPTGAGRPGADIHVPEITASNLSFAHVPRPSKVVPQRKAPTGRQHSVRHDAPGDATAGVHAAAS